MLRPRILRPFPRRYASTLAEARRRWNGRLVLSEEVEHALETGGAVVALESTIITHGMPHPTNLTTALSVESIVRSHSAVPATIGLLDGKVHVGLGRDQLTALADPATPRGLPPVKTSRRDLAAVLATRRTGGTTVAGTMVVAHSVGIGAFVTGGIGGVHRGAESSMDISADLIELGRTPMMVVCAGAKSILDIPRTLEVLETEGVCVAAYGDKAEFPAFYTPSSGCPTPWAVGNVGDAADLVYTGLTLPTPQSTLLAVPIPSEYAARGDEVQTAVEQAVRESIECGVDKRGKEVTPWLLKRVGELTGGTALELNIKLIENNAHVGAQVARQVARLHASRSAYCAASPSPSARLPPLAALGNCTEYPGSAATQPHSHPASPPSLPAPSVLVFGSAAIDITSTSPGPIAPHTTTPGSVILSPGGVGRNIAEAAQALLPPGEIMLVSALGTGTGTGTSDNAASPQQTTPPPDAFGQVLRHELAACGLRTDGLVHIPGSTAACSLVLEKGGDLVAGVADMDIVETMDPDMISTRIAQTHPHLVVFDCNLSTPAITSLLSTCAAHSIPALCDPTSHAKTARLLPGLLAHPRALTHLMPNALELDHLYELTADNPPEHAWTFINALDLGANWRAGVDALANRRGAWIRTEGAAAKMVAVLPYVGGVWLKAGERGLLHLRIERGVSGTSGDRWDTQNSVIHKLPPTHAVGGHLVLTHYAPPDIAAHEVVSTTGAGDTLAGGLVAGLVQGGDERGWVARAVENVGRTLRSRRAVGV